VGGGDVRNMTLAQMLDRFERIADEERTPSRYAASTATPEHVRSVSEGSENFRTVAPSTKSSHGGLSGWLTKALAEGVGSAGGYMVPVEIAGEVLTMLRARSTVMSFARVVPVKKELRIVSLVESASAEYANENEPIPISQQTFAETPLLRPKRLSALVPVSNRLLRDAADSPDADVVIREDIAAVMALRADRALLLGDGPDPEPVGIFNKAGLTPGPDMGTNGSAPDYDTLKETAALLREQNAPFNKPGWIFHPRTLATFDRLKDSNGRYLSDNGLLTFDSTGGGGTLLGFPFRTSTQIPVNLTAGSSTDCTLVYFSSDWSECWIGQNEQLEIQVSSEAAYVDNASAWHSAFQADQSLFRASTHHDIGLRRPELFVVIEGVRA
jgi:HK97 family phage major capsid protein